MATSFLTRKPDSGLGNIGASPADPARNIDWVLMPQTIAVTVIGATAIILAIGVAGTWHTLSQKTATLLRND